jgi:hypothetical protein
MAYRFRRRHCGFETLLRRYVTEWLEWRLKSANAVFRSGYSEEPSGHAWTWLVCIVGICAATRLAVRGAGPGFETRTACL